MTGRERRLYPALFVLAACIAGAFILIKCMEVIRITSVALAAAYLLSPAVSRLERKMHRSLAVLIVYASLILVFAGLVFLVFLPMISELNGLDVHAARAIHSLQALSGRLSDALNARGIAPDVFDTLFGGLGADSAKILPMVISAVSGMAGFLANALAALALSWFFLLDWERLSLRLFLCVPSGIRKKVVTAFLSVRRELGQYLRAQSMLILVIGVITVAILWLTRAPMPVSMGVMYALLNAIPYFGPLIGIFPPVLSALSVSPVNALYTAVALLLIQQIDNYFLSPRIMGAVSNSGPATILLAISLGGALFGVPGMFLALPALVTVKSVYRVFTLPKTEMHQKITKQNEKRH